MTTTTPTTTTTSEQPSAQDQLVRDVAEAVAAGTISEADASAVLAALAAGKLVLQNDA
jgi:hypothetical protein